MISNSFEWFTVDSDGRHVVEGTSEPMFPVMAVALITLLSRLGDAFVREIVRPAKWNLQLIISRVCVSTWKKSESQTGAITFVISNNHVEVSILHSQISTFIYAFCSLRAIEILKKGRSNFQYVTIITTVSVKRLFDKLSWFFLGNFRSGSSRFQWDINSTEKLISVLIPDVQSRLTHHINLSMLFLNNGMSTSKRTFCELSSFL